MKALSVVLVWSAIVGFALLFGGCATTGELPVDFDRCQSRKVMDACNPADLPPLTDALPAWPFPKLLVPLPEEKR